MAQRAEVAAIVSHVMGRAQHSLVPHASRDAVSIQPLEQRNHDAPRTLKHLTQLDRLGIIELKPLNRYRLKALVKQGKTGAILATQLLSDTERLLGMILIGNTVINAAASALVTAIAISRFGSE